MSSSNPNPRRVPILDSFPNAPVRHRRGRGGRLRGLGSIRGGTSGFAIRGMSAEVAIALRASFGTPLSLERAQAMLSKRKVVEEDSEDDEDEDTSLVVRPRARRRIISEDEAEISPTRASSPVNIVSDDETTPGDTIESTQRLFTDGFESGELGPVLDEVPLSSSIPIPPLVPSTSLPILSVPASLPISAPLTASTPSTPVIFTSSTAPPSIAPPSSVQYAEEGSSSKSLAMRSVTLEVPANNSLLRKSGGVDANLIGTKLMGRISLLEKKARESDKTILEAERAAKEAQLETTNWKEHNRNLEQQKRTLTSELAKAKASSSKAEKDKERLECSFSEKLSKSSEEIRELKALLNKKEEYAGELVQNLTQAQADLKISSDKVHALENEAPMAEEPLNEEAAAVAIEVENVVIPAPVGETSMNQFEEAEASVTLAPLDESNISIPAETASVAVSSEVTVPESEADITTSDVPAPQ
ncbi:PREDICTED: PR domain zinc finger protein 2-like [Nicotiana attenuata]|uniref:PR domain zinc finger protein 2-like n=1 Tax=Nicotiana attenuata TaxID=49451 RepID=UPI0009058D46|nr:PREDICTED: PR domain zinc finger protein 2-like [Nicotiana attenuata]